jgi:hypothetical protein
LHDTGYHVGELVRDDSRDEKKQNRGMNNATARGGSAKDGQVASVLTANVTRFAVDSTVNQREDVDEEEGDVIDQNADADTDETKDRD